MTDRRFINHQHLDSGGARLKVECRFCTHKEEYNRFQHVAPCGCSGSSRYVHRRCLQSWFIVKFQHVYNQAYEGDPLQFNVFCQICQQKMEIEFSLTKKCSKYDQILQKLAEDKLALVGVILFGLASVAVLVFIIVFSQLAYINNNLLAIVITICLITLVADISYFCCKFLLIKSIDIDYIANHKDPPKLLALAAEDINNLDQIQSYKNDPHFGQALSRNLADKSLMLDSNKNSGSEKKSSMESKTFTDIVMRQMYHHDLPSQRQKYSNEVQMNEDAQQRSRNTTTFRNKSRTDRDIKSSNYEKEYVEQSIQVTAFRDKKESVDDTKYKQANQKQDKSVQMSRNEKSSYGEKSKSSKSRTRKIFEKPSEEREVYTPEFKKDISRREYPIDQEKVEQRVLFPKGSQEEFELKKQNQQKLKSSYSEDEFRPTVKKIEMIELKSSGQISKPQKQNKVKLNKLTDPIKIKIRL